MKKGILGLLLVFGAQQIKTSPFWYKAFSVGITATAGYITAPRLNTAMDRAIKPKNGGSVPFSLFASTAATGIAGYNVISNRPTLLQRFNPFKSLSIARAVRPLGVAASLGWMASGLTKWLK